MNTLHAWRAAACRQRLIRIAAVKGKERSILCLARGAFDTWCDVTDAALNVAEDLIR
jgi:hypothetical protein